MRSLIAATITVSLLALTAACGDDDDSDRTTAAYCADLEALGDDGDPTAAFFEEHPDPTIEDWAEGLPDIISTVRASRDEFADVEASADLEDEREELLEGLDAIVTSFEDSLAAAEAGDQEEFDRLEAENQDENVPAMFTAMETLQSACE